jgi:hypothetical protein
MISQMKSCIRLIATMNLCPFMVSGISLLLASEPAASSATAVAEGGVGEGGQKQWDRFRLKVPMKIGDVVLKVTMARFARPCRCTSRCSSSHAAQVADAGWADVATGPDRM